MSQLHKNFTDEQVKELMERYLNKEIERKYIQGILSIKKRRFFILIKNYRENPDSFSIQYSRKNPTRSIPKPIENNIIKELTIDKNIIINKDVPLKRYNYSYIKDILKDRKSTRLNSSHIPLSRMPSSA